MRLVLTNGIAIYRSPEDTGSFLQWHIENPPNAALTFKVERAQSPEGPFDLVADNLKNFYYYDNSREIPGLKPEDARENVNLLSLLRSIYYRVTATTAAGDTASATSELANVLPPRLQGLQRKMQRDLSMGLKFNGVDTYMLKRLHWGLRCKACFDVLTKKVTASKCENCYGTGFEQGYATPVQIKVRYLAPNSDTQVSPQGWTDIVRIRAICLPFPRMYPGDVLVEKLSNSRYLVMQNSQTELRRDIVHQALSISELSRDSVEYRIPVNTDHVPVMY